MRWTWWDWSLILRTYLPSVLWHCWLGQKPNMTYNVFGGMLNLAQSNPIQWFFNWLHCHVGDLVVNLVCSRLVMYLKDSLYLWDTAWHNVFWRLITESFLLTAPSSNAICMALFPWALLLSTALLTLKKLCTISASFLCWKPLSLSTMVVHTLLNTAHTVGSDCSYNPGWCRSHPTVSEMT